MKKLLRERKVFNGAALWAFKILCCCLLGFQRLKFSSNVRLYLKEPCMKWSFFFFEERECLCMCVCRVELSLSVSLGLDFSKREKRGKRFPCFKQKEQKAQRSNRKPLVFSKNCWNGTSGLNHFHPQSRIIGLEHPQRSSFFNFFHIMYQRTQNSSFGKLDVCNYFCKFGLVSHTLPSFGTKLKKQV